MLFILNSTLPFHTWNWFSKQFFLEKWRNIHHKISENDLYELFSLRHEIPTIKLLHWISHIKSNRGIKRLCICHYSNTCQWRYNQNKWLSLQQWNPSYRRSQENNSNTKAGNMNYLKYGTGTSKGTISKKTYGNAVFTKMKSVIFSDSMIKILKINSSIYISVLEKCITKPFLVWDRSNLIIT